MALREGLTFTAVGERCIVYLSLTLILHDAALGVVGPSRYQFGVQNAATQTALTIAACENACASTPNCCGGNIKLTTAATGNPGSCTLILKPAAETVCSDDEMTLTNLNADNNAAFF